MKQQSQTREDMEPERTESQSQMSVKSDKAKRSTKITVQIRAKAPASSSCQIPILSVLSKAPVNGMLARDVLKQVKGLFGDLEEDDLAARYPSSKKKITDTVIKFCKKNLAMKNQIYQTGHEGIPIGIWKITRIGQARAAMEIGGWKPRYTRHDAILVRNKDEE